MERFDHEKLDVYRVAIEFVGFAQGVIEEMPRGRASLADQLQRAAMSIPLNIAEGAGEYAPKEKARFYRMARRSATECAAILEVCTATRAFDPTLLESGRDQLLRIVAMLIKLVDANS